MSKSLYAFSIKGQNYEDLAKSLEKFVENSLPTEDDETEGFINFTKSEKEEYVYFEYYYSHISERPDPAGRGTYKVLIKRAVPIAITKDPLLMLIFTGIPKVRDRILEKIPIDTVHRESILFSPDFIEFINVPEPKKWRKIIFKDKIEPIGRKGRAGDTHEYIERYLSGPDKRDKDLDKKAVFREFSEVVIAKGEVLIPLIIYPGGKTKLKQYKFTHHIVPFVAESLKILKEAETTYNTLKKNAQGEGSNGGNQSK